MVRDPNNLPVQGVQARLWNSAGDVWVSSATDEDGRYEIIVADEPVVGTWTISLIVGEQPLSPSYSFRTSLGCANGLQEYRIDWQRGE